MSRNKKLITILLSMVFVLSVCTITVFATDLDGDGYDDETGEYIGQATEYVPPETQAPIETEPYVPPTTVYVPPATEAPAQSSDDYNYGSSQNYYSSSNNYYSSSQSNYSSSSSNYYINDNGQSSYLGGGQSYVTPQSTAPSASLYDANENIDSNELSSKDWKEITANLKNASNSSDGDDFGFIQNNTSTGDNGEGILIAGIVCVILSIAGIVYVVVSSIKAGKNTSASKTGGKLAHAGAAGSGSKSRYSSKSYYGDGYRSAGNSKKTAVRRSKFDTADVVLPKSKKNSRGNDSNRRYR